MRTLAVTTAALVLLAVPATGSARTAGERAENRMIGAINEARSHHGLHALRTSSSLTESARRFSSWLLERDTFGHLSRIRASSRFDLLGEALAMHSGRRFRVRATLARWMGSPTHRAIVLSPSMRWLGAGAARGRMGAVPATTWVLHVGRLRASVPGLPSLPRLPG